MRLLQTIPIEPGECAAIDGARYRIFQPFPGGARPGSYFPFVLVFAWNGVIPPGAKSQPSADYRRKMPPGPQWWYMSVLILIMIAPVIIMAIALERYIARGLLVGAVKG
jgi:multiple sugar transport system permease protein